MGKLYNEDHFHKNGNKVIKLESKKRPFRYELINYLIEIMNKEIKYLEIGVRNPEENFNKINASQKFGVDPGIENPLNPVQFKMTSDDFFSKLHRGDILEKNIKFDIIFIDGLHLAAQVERDIYSALEFLEEDGFVVLHDCNPPTEFNASENYHYKLSPSKGFWNGTTWKAFYKFRQESLYSSCCIDSDWGLGIISKTINFGGYEKIENPYFEYSIFHTYRKESLNLVSFEEFTNLVCRKSP